MKKSTSIFLLISMLFQCCTVYQKTPVALSDAANRGKTKVVTTNNKKQKFSNIEVKNGSYIGIKIVRQKNEQGAYKTIDKSKQLYQDSINAIYLKKVVTKAWIKVKNQPKYTEGILYQVNDSSIILAESDKSKDYSTGHIEFPISDVLEIKLRAKSKVAKGAAIGAMSGIAVELILISVDPFNLLVSPLILVTAAIGAVIGSKKKIYTIDGNVEKYIIIKDELKTYDLIR